MRIRYCWWCDRPFLGRGYRRWVVTGRSDRTFAGALVSGRGAWVGGSTGRFRGLRLLCYPCACAIDEANDYDPALDLLEEARQLAVQIWQPPRSVSATRFGRAVHAVRDWWVIADC
jgi:hypothetical protein